MTEAAVLVESAVCDDVRLTLVAGNLVMNVS